MSEIKNYKPDTIDTILGDLQERRKELSCLYELEKFFYTTELTVDEIFRSIIEIIPSGLQFPNIAQVKILYNDRVFSSPEYQETSFQQTAKIKIQEKIVGELIVSYSRKLPITSEGCFLKEETQLIGSIAERIGHMLLYKKLNGLHDQWQKAGEKLNAKTTPEWRIIIDLIQKSNKELFLFLSQKMLYHLCWKGINEAKILLKESGHGLKSNLTYENYIEDLNQPISKKSMDKILSIDNETFRIASENLSENYILNLIQQWIEYDKSRFLVKILENPNSSLADLLNAITRFHYLEDEGLKINYSTEKSLRASLIRYFFSDQLEFINIAKNYIKIDDYYDLVKNIIFSAKSGGKLGGKSSGLFLASCILRASEEHKKLFKKINIPKTWYITADEVMNFLHYNNLENVFEQKYKDMDEIHVEYTNIIQIFKNSHFSQEIIRGLSIALDDFGETPIIVRSSSLLEDRFGSSFSGKYKSLFLANQGSKKERLDALTDAIAEVYASTFSPDPIAYRSEMGLLDFNEKMGIMIQEVVGTKIGNYYLPSFAGVAFSNNEFRWSSRIKQKDGLIRMVPGLGTRAVDRISEDYPVLIAPAKADLRVNVTSDEIIQYSPKNIDIINLDTNSLETVEIKWFIEKFGNQIPEIQNIVSVVNGDLIRKPTSLFNIDFEKDELLVTFEGLLQKTDFVKNINNMLKLLEDKLGTPVDIEFAHNGSNFYLLQCRPQSYSQNIQPAPIPKDIQENKIAFSANRYISNGYIQNITHIVYVDPDAYSLLSSISELKNIGYAVGKLNKILPKRQFILMGPGRWGSRGDIKLGVNVTYSDINNCAALIEIAKKKGNYVPELSFGTHFFQDLVEASIHYLPLYPDEKGIIFNEVFFTKSDNMLPELLPEFADLDSVIRVIDVAHSANGSSLHIFMNAELDEAIGIFEDPKNKPIETSKKEISQPRYSDDYWIWRLNMANRIASQLDPKRFGVKGFYVFGSTKNATAGPGSDIDILIHFIGTDTQKKELLLWLEGWGLSLAEVNFKRTGYKSTNLLDIHLVTNQDIEKKHSYAIKIGAVTDAAKPLKMGTSISK